MNIVLCNHEVFLALVFQDNFSTSTNFFNLIFQIFLLSLFSTDYIAAQCVAEFEVFQASLILAVVVLRHVFIKMSFSLKETVGNFGYYFFWRFVNFF